MLPFVIVPVVPSQVVYSVLIKAAPQTTLRDSRLKSRVTARMTRSQQTLYLTVLLFLLRDYSLFSLQRYLISFSYNTRFFCYQLRLI